MKKIDKDGLILCAMQGNIFATSLEQTDTSSEIFMRRFMTSEIVREFDSKAVLNDSLTIQSVFEYLDGQFGESSYGKVKYNREVLFWIGYLYRYMAYTYELTSKYIYKLIKPKELNEIYFAYHSFDCAQAIERILEAKEICFDIEKQNEMLLEMMRKRKYEKVLRIVSSNDFEYCLDPAESISGYANVAEDVICKEKDMSSNMDFAILYCGNHIGDIALIKDKSSCFKIDLELNGKQYANRGIESFALEKSIEYLMKHFANSYFKTKISKSDEKIISILKKQGFQYDGEGLDYVLYSKKL